MSIQTHSPVRPDRRRDRRPGRLAASSPAGSSAARWARADRTAASESPPACSSTSRERARPVGRPAGARSEAILKTHADEIVAHVKAGMDARRALHDAVLAQPTDEAAHPQRSAAQVGTVHADGALLFAKIRSEIWPILTPSSSRSSRRSTRGWAAAATTGSSRSAPSCGAKAEPCASWSPPARPPACARRRGHPRRAGRARAIRTRSTALVRLAAPTALAAARRVTGDASLAEDAAQEAFLRAFRALDRYRPQSSFRAWVRTIAIRCAIDLVRRRRPESPLPDAQPAPGERGDAPRGHGPAARGARRALRRSTARS